MVIMVVDEGSYFNEKSFKDKRRIATLKGYSGELPLKSANPLILLQPSKRTIGRPIVLL
jgi:hypothetical protein